MEVGGEFFKRTKWVEFLLRQEYNSILMEFIIAEKDTGIFMTQVIEQNRNKLAELCRKYCVSRLDVFGSAAAGDFDEQTSDIDFLVEFDKSVKQNRFDNFFALHEELQKLFERPVDLVEPGGLKNPYFIESVNQTRKKIYADS